MSVVTVTEAQLPTVLRWHVEGTGRAIVRGVRKSLQKAKRHLVSVTPKDKGGARRGWKVKKTGTPTEVTNQLHGTIGEIANDSPIIGILEMGARPHKVSWEGQFAIYTWVERHFRLNKSGNLIQGTKGIGLGNARSSAWKRAQLESTFYFSGGEKLTKAGSLVQLAIVSMHPEYAGRLVPAALNITGAIILKIMTKGQAPKYFVRDSMDLIAIMCQMDVEASIRDRMSRAGGWKAIP